MSLSVLVLHSVFLISGLQLKDEWNLSFHPVHLAVGNVSGGEAEELIILGRSLAGDFHPLANILRVESRDRSWFCDFETAGIPSDVTLGDFDQNGLMDVAVSHEGAAVIAVFLQDRPWVNDCSSYRRLDHSTLAHGLRLRAIDLDQDEAVDLVWGALSSPLSIFINRGLKRTKDSLFAEGFPLGWIVAPNQILGQDLNGDQKLDLVIGAASLSAGIHFWTQLGIDCNENRETCAVQGVLSTDSSLGSLEPFLLRDSTHFLSRRREEWGGGVWSLSHNSLKIVSAQNLSQSFFLNSIGEAFYLLQTNEFNEWVLVEGMSATANGLWQRCTLDFGALPQGFVVTNSREYVFALSSPHRIMIFTRQL